MTNAHGAGQQVMGWIEHPTPVERVVANVAHWDDDALASLQVSLTMALGDPVFGPLEQRDIAVMLWAIENEEGKRRGRAPVLLPASLLSKPEETDG